MPTSLTTRRSTASCIAVLSVLAALLARVADAAPRERWLPGPQHDFNVTREGDPGLPNHTVFRPTDLAAPKFMLPVVLWANGGCRESNEEYRYFLMNFARRGFFIVANGAPENAYRPEELEGLAVPEPEQLEQSLDWVTAQSKDRRSRYHGLLDTSRIVLMGQSCGGWEALDVSDDHRVTSTLVWNNGSGFAPGRGDLGALRQPVAFLVGVAPADYVAPTARVSYEAVPESVPVVYAAHDTAGHTGWWDDPDPADGVTPEVMKQPLLLAQKWLELTLYGQPSGQAYFVGDGCGLCETDGFSDVRSKQWEHFDRAPSTAPRRAGAR